MKTSRLRPAETPRRRQPARLAIEALERRVVLSAAPALGCIDWQDTLPACYWQATCEDNRESAPCENDSSTYEENPSCEETRWCEENPSCEETPWCEENPSCEEYPQYDNCNEYVAENSSDCEQKPVCQEKPECDESPWAASENESCDNWEEPRCEKPPRCEWEPECDSAPRKPPWGHGDAGWRRNKPDCNGDDYEESAAVAWSRAKSWSSSRSDSRCEPNDCESTQRTKQRCVEKPSYDDCQVVDRCLSDTSWLTGMLRGLSRCSDTV